MNDHGFFLYLFLIFAIFGAFNQRRSAANDWILLLESRFWGIVAREDHPLIVLTARGFLRKRPCYLYPHQGVIFFTWSRPETLPQGTILVPAI